MADDKPPREEVTVVPSVVTVTQPVPQKIEVVAAAFSGPLPPPQVLEGYNRSHPDAAKIIIEMAVEQGKHRRELEMEAMRAQISMQQRGQWFAFGVAVFGLVTTITCAYLQQPWVAGVIGGTTLLGMMSIFIKGKTEQEKDLEKKRSGQS